MSSYTHVELAIGEASGDGGQMANVARIYNDNVGVVSDPSQTEPPCAHVHTTHVYVYAYAQELCQRTGRNPAVRRLNLFMLDLVSNHASPRSRSTRT